MPAPPDVPSPYGDWGVPDYNAGGVIFGAVFNLPADLSRPVTLPPGYDWVGAAPVFGVDYGPGIAGEPAPAAPPAEPPPTPTPQPPPTTFPPAEPANDPVILPRTPVTPQPLPPAGEPTIPPAPQLPTSDIPGGEPAPGWDLPPVLPSVARGIPGAILIGGVLWPSPIEPDYGLNVPMPDIPAPPIPQPVVRAPPVPITPPELALPPAPDVVEVTAKRPVAPTVPRAQPLPNPAPSPRPWSPVLWPFPRSYAPPGRVVQPQPASPPLPRAPPAPVSPPQPVPTSPPRVSPPGLPSSPGSPRPLTPAQEAPVESAPTCETPAQTRDRRARNRENCRKLISIKVRAHYRKVCVSHAVEHEIKKERRKLVREYVTRPAGKAGRAAADWALEHMGLTPYSQQAKDVKKRVGQLTRKEPPVTIPGTDIRINPEALLPKWSKL